MDDLEQLVERAHQSSSSPHRGSRPIGRRFLVSTASGYADLAARERPRARQLYFVGSGGSWASMYSGKELADRLDRGTGGRLAVLRADMARATPARIPKPLVIWPPTRARPRTRWPRCASPARAGARTVALVEQPPTRRSAARRTRRSPTTRPALYCMPLLPSRCSSLRVGPARGQPGGGRTAGTRCRTARPDGRRLPSAPRARAASWPSRWPTPAAVLPSGPARSTGWHTSSG